MQTLILTVVTVLILILSVATQVVAAEQDSKARLVSKPIKQYGFHIQADFRAAAKSADTAFCIPIKVRVSQTSHLLRSLSWPSSQYHSEFSADGLLEEREGHWQWQVPAEGGVLQYCAQLNHSRGPRFDSRITKNWALFRADDLVPAASSRVRRNSHSQTELEFLLPNNWSSITRYPESAENVYNVDNPARLFDRPTGWVQLGELGVRRNLIARTQVAVSAPTGQEVRRLEILTFLTFTLPTVRDWFVDFPERLLVVSATDDMWRGALSGPGSLFLHGDRPLVSENGTSTLLHELVHVAMQREATRDADWIDEGLAEYLALVLLHEAGGLTRYRFKTALETQREWGITAKKLARKNSQGAATAKAVSVFAQLHQELGDQQFRQLVNLLAQPGPAISNNLLRELAEQVAGKAITSLP